MRKRRTTTSLKSTTDANSSCEGANVVNLEVDTDLLRWLAKSCDNGEQTLSDVCQLIAPDVGSASSCLSVAEMFNDASTFLGQQAHDLAGRIRAVADEFERIRINPLKMRVGICIRLARPSPQI